MVKPVARQQGADCAGVAAAEVICQYAPGKSLVCGSGKWYVDFDKCLPYFNQTMGCGICIAVCPSRSGVARNLVAKSAAGGHAAQDPAPP
jgi:epoxyqueuosine reductase